MSQPQPSTTQLQPAQLVQPAQPPQPVQPVQPAVQWNRDHIHTLIQVRKNTNSVIYKKKYKYINIFYTIIKLKITLLLYFYYSGIGVC